MSAASERRARRWGKAERSYQVRTDTLAGALQAGAEQYDADWPILPELAQTVDTAFMNRMCTQPPGQRAEIAAAEAGKAMRTALSIAAQRPGVKGARAPLGGGWFIACAKPGPTS